MNENQNLRRSDHNHPDYTKSSSGRANLASCVVATVFLLAIAAAVVAIYFFVFKPKQPVIAVNSVQFPTFSIFNDNVNFVFFQYLSVTNPNHDEFSHYESSLQLVYSGQSVGNVFISGKIGGGGSQKMSAKFDLQNVGKVKTMGQSVKLKLRPVEYQEIIRTFSKSFNYGILPKGDSVAWSSLFSHIPTFVKMLKYQWDA